MLRRLLAVALSLALAAGLTACGNKQSKTLTAATEGIYVDLGDLKYQVEISRTLNAADPEDREYLKGVTTQLGPDDVWFAVFVRVENDGSKLQHPATQFDIIDTLGNVFNPVPIDLKSNDFGYNPVSLPAKALLPNVDAIAAQNSIGGELLLFKMTRQTLDNRPLELKIHDPADSTTVGTVNLDV